MQHPVVDSGHARVMVDMVLTVPSEEAVKNSDPVLLCIHIVLNTGSVCATDRGISPAGRPPILTKEHLLHLFPRLQVREV